MHEHREGVPLASVARADLQLGAAHRDVKFLSLAGVDVKDVKFLSLAGVDVKAGFVLFDMKSRIALDAFVVQDDVATESAFACLLACSTLGVVSRHRFNNGPLALCGGAALD